MMLYNLQLRKLDKREEHNKHHAYLQTIKCEDTLPRDPQVRKYFKCNNTKGDSYKLISYILMFISSIL